MTRLRQQAINGPFDAELSRRIESGARQALIMRTAIGVMTLASVALGATLAS